MKELANITFETIRNEQIRLRNKNLKTNLFLTEEKFIFLSDKKAKIAYQSENGFFLLIESDDFYKYYFVINNINDLDENLKFLQDISFDKTIVCEIVGNKNYIMDLQNELLENKFYIYTSLFRMNKLRRINGNFHLEENIYQLKEDKLPALQEIYNIYFNKFAEQIPGEKELLKMVQENNIYYFSDNDEIQGFIIFENTGIVSHLRYWFVHPEYRGKKIGSKLMDLFFNKFDQVKKEIFWVIESNDNAIKRYKHFGFEKEEMYNIVLINKNIKYEEQDY